MRRFPPVVGIGLTTITLVAPVGAQDVPSGLAALELARSRDCVGVIARLTDLEGRLAPIGVRTDRLLTIARAVEVEERSVVGSLDASDAVEARVLAWFEADEALAQRYLVEPGESILAERHAGREAILDFLRETLTALQDEADSTIAETGELPRETTRCDGAVLVRSAVLEACADTESPVCPAARDSSRTGSYRFVEAPTDLWDMQEIRPWSAPGPLQVGPDGQLGGARTQGSTRIGNLRMTTTFSPMIRTREELAPEEVAELQAIDEALGFRSAHPGIVFAPSLTFQADLPAPLGGETEYLLHFGAPEDADVVWAAPAGSAPRGVVALAPEHVVKLAEGQTLSLTAVRRGSDESGEGVFSIQLSDVGQAANVRSLAGYMSEQLDADLVRLIPPPAP